MENSTSSSWTSIMSTNTMEILHVPYAVIDLILSIISVHFLITLIIFLVKEKRKKSSHLISFSLENRYGTLSLLTCLFVTVCSLIRNLISAGGFLWVETRHEMNSTSNVTDVNLDLTSQMICNVSFGIGNLSFTLGTSFVYLFLWFRQRIFYIHPAFHFLRNKCVNVASIGVILVWFVFVVLSSIFYIVYVRFTFNEIYNACLFSTHLSWQWFQGILIMWSAISTLMQLTLLGLFLYPLFRQESWRKQNNLGDSTLLKRVKKAVLLTSISLITDIVVVVMITSIKSPLNIISYNLNLFINNVVIICCFDNWKTILFPCTRRSEKLLSQSKSSSSTKPSS